MPLVHLNWFRDPAGYELQSRSDSDDILIVRRGKMLFPTQPLLGDDVLWREFAACTTPEHALDFVGRHGFLGIYRSMKSESVRQFLENASDMRSWVRAIDGRHWDRLSEVLDKAPRGSIGRIGLALVPPDEPGPPELQFQPANLWQAMLVQALMDATGGTEHKRCANPGCPVFFRFGPGTEHRVTAKYHSPKCQLAHAYAKRKAAKK